MIDWESIGAKLWELLSGAAVSTGILLLLGGCFVLLAAALQLTTLSLRRRWFDLLGERSWIILAAPGTIVHEAGHALFCLLFRHRIVEIKLFSPAPDGTLGCVNHSWDAKSLYQRTGNFFIGAGPVIFGVAVIAAVTAWLAPDLWDRMETPECRTLGDMAAGVISLFLRMLRGLLSGEFWTKWQSFLWLFLVLLIGSHMTLSKADLKNTGSGACLIPFILFFVNLALIWLCNPAEAVLKYGGGRLAGIMAVVLFILLILAAFAALLHLPVFQPGSPSGAKGRKK